MRVRIAQLLGGAAIAGLLPLAAGCAQQPASGTAASATPTATATGTGTAGVAAGANCVSGVVTITVADDNKSLCVTTGTAIVVLLRGSARSKWMSLHATSTALGPRTNPAFMLQVGETGAAYSTIRPGSATISAVKYACPTTGGTPTGMAHCGAMVEFRVSVTVVPDSQHG